MIALIEAETEFPRPQTQGGTPAVPVIARWRVIALAELFEAVLFLVVAYDIAAFLATLHSAARWWSFPVGHQ